MGNSSDLSKELLRYGKLRYDLEYHTVNGTCIRVRVIDYQNKTYIHRMINGEVIELTEI